MKTIDNLWAAFAGESQANRKYLAFAKKAEAEGYPQIARLFRAAAEAETVHAHAHLRVAGGIKGTEENLKAAIEGETHEYKSMYPEFIEVAEAEGHKQALMNFKYANAVEELHAGLYREALAVFQSGKDLPVKAIYICAVCGNTVYDEPQEKCSVCGAPKTQFKEIE